MKMGRKIMKARIAYGAMTKEEASDIKRLNRLIRSLNCKLEIWGEPSEGDTILELIDRDSNSCGCAFRWNKKKQQFEDCDHAEARRIEKEMCS